MGREIFALCASSCKLLLLQVSPSQLWEKMMMMMRHELQNHCFEHPTQKLLSFTQTCHRQIWVCSLYQSNMDTQDDRVTIYIIQPVGVIKVVELIVPCPPKSI